MKGVYINDASHVPFSGIRSDVSDNKGKFKDAARTTHIRKPPTNTSTRTRRDKRGMNEQRWQPSLPQSTDVCDDALVLL